MLSYNWDHQDVIKRINKALQTRGYMTWIDVEKMQGSTIETMAEAVEQAACVVYGISQAYKESANCRLEAQYAHQREKHMVPLMLEEGYRADGWLGMLLGVSLWYGFFGPTLASERAFEDKLDELCRELGDRGQNPMGAGSADGEVSSMMTAADTVPSTLALERNELSRQMQQIYSQPVSLTADQASVTSSVSQQLVLSEAFYLERCAGLCVPLSSCARLI